MSDMAHVKKVELHLHLEGAAQPDFIRQIAFEKKVDLSGIFTTQGGYDIHDFVHFLRVYEAATSVLTTPEDYARLTRSVLEASARHGVVYCETFLSPDFCGHGDLGAWRDYLSAMTEAADAAERDFGITMRGVITAVRHFGPDQAKRAARCAAETAGRMICGFGMAGDEKIGHVRDFSWSFDCAAEAGLPFSIHAGEWGGAQSVRETLDTYNPPRIGHGVEAISDPDLIARLADTGVVLECCPVSNVFLGVFPNWKSHPLARLREAGVKVTVSTDDPPFFHTNMSREYEALEQHFGWGEAEFIEINQTALAAAFCDQKTRTRVGKRLEG